MRIFRGTRDAAGWARSRFLATSSALSHWRIHWCIGVATASLLVLGTGCGGDRTRMLLPEDCADDDPDCQSPALRRRDAGVVGGRGSGTGIGSGGGSRAGGASGSAGRISSAAGSSASGSRSSSAGSPFAGSGGSSRSSSGGSPFGGSGGSSRGGTGGISFGGSGGSSRGGTGGTSTACGTREICDNSKDDDCNGRTDCEDSACQNQPSCINRKKESCNNGIDDDGNGLTDCKDPACAGDPACFVIGREICNNNLDDDEDGLVDCKDPDCASDPLCAPRAGIEVCDNGKDDNGDGLVDCTDPKCKDFPACLAAACVAEVDFGDIARSGASVTRTLSTVGATASYSTCATPGGAARVASFNLPEQADLRVDFSQPQGAAHVVALYRAGVGQACDQNVVDCLHAGDQRTATQTYTRLAAGHYWLIVQSYAGAAGATNVTLSTGQASVAEICNNGKDDDGDGAIDCADLDCRTVSYCPACVPDINLGTVVVGDPPKTTVVDTTTGSNRYHPSCAGTSTGKDVVVRFTTKATAGLLIEISQTGDHAYGIFAAPEAGQACDKGKSDCYYIGGRGAVRTSWWPFAPGEYLLIFKPIAEGKEGRINVSLSAFADRGIEICDNQIDDDGNNLIDCEDPACANTVTCLAPMCLPDDNLGNIDVGDSKTLTVDLTTATRTYSTYCGKGDGYGRVYRLHLQQGMGLGVSCTQTGQQVLQLSAQTSPLDPCESNSIDCVDPLYLPFGCNFIIPSLQPGDYNFLVHSFTKGNEGKVNLTLLGVRETVLEICNNGKDDDGDGAVDCYDRKCAGDTNCKKVVCKVDKAIGTLPLEGTITMAALQTSGAGDDQIQTSCVSVKGGADAVASFKLTSKADLTIEWNQAGNHALVLYKEDDPRLPCDANIPIDCHATAGTTNGSYKVTGLDLGKYYLVADADKAGAEGAVILQITGSPSP